MKKILVSALMLFTSPAFAAQPTLLSTYGNWKVYKADGVCFAACQPEKSEGDYTKRDDAFLMVSFRPSEGVKGEVSSILGFPAKSDSTAEVMIDGDKFVVHTTEEAAFVDDDAKVVNAMKKGSKFILQSQSKRGTNIKDTYSLSGATNAIEAAQKACK